LEINFSTEAAPAGMRAKKKKERAARRDVH